VVVFSFVAESKLLNGSNKPRLMSLPKQNPTQSFWLNQNPLANYRTTTELPDNGKRATNNILVLRFVSKISSFSQRCDYWLGLNRHRSFINIIAEISTSLYHSVRRYVSGVEAAII
jgi:hypothetical protein